MEDADTLPRAFSVDRRAPLRQAEDQAEPRPAVDSDGSSALEEGRGVGPAAAVTAAVAAVTSAAVVVQLRRKTERQVT